MMDPLSTPTIGFVEFVKFLKDQLSTIPVGDMDPQTRKLYSYFNRLRRSEKMASLSDNQPIQFHDQQDSFPSSEPEQQQDVVYPQRSSMYP